MQKSISLQPYGREVKVELDRGMLRENFFGYGELEGRMIRAEVTVEFEGEVVSARLKFDQEKNYPLMSLI